MTDTEILNKFDDFINKWCEDNASHLLDNDDNDGEKMRQAILKYADVAVQQERERILKGIEDDEFEDSWGVLVVSSRAMRDIINNKD